MTTVTGDRHHRATYTISAGNRHLVAQRIDGRVALIDEPVDHDGRVYLVERHVTSLAELDSICDAYTAHSEAADKPGVLAHRQLLAELSEPTR